MAVSLQRQLFKQLAFTTILPILVTSLAIYWFAVRFANQIYDQDLLESASSLASQVQRKGGVVSLQLPPPAVEMFVWDEVNKIRFRIDSKRRGFLSGFRELPLLPPARNGAAIFYDEYINNDKIRAVVISLPQESLDDEVTVSVSETLNKRRQLAARLSLLVIIPQSLLIIITTILLRVGVRRGLRSLDMLEQTIHERRLNDLTPLPTLDVPKELQPFTSAINTLLERLNEALSTQQRFIENAAHQLRTPLTTLKLQVEQAIREAGPAAPKLALHGLRATIDRTARLSNQLLLLARAEPGSELVLHMHRVDLRALALATGATWVPRALAQGADLGIEGDECPCWVMGDELLLGEAINNLIDNALRYGGKSVCVTLKVESRQGHCELMVEDNGPGVPESQRDAVLDRFHRVPGSPAGGSGLGLSIVQEIARAHKAELSLDSPASGGLRVRMVFAAVSGGT
ncbi:MAG: Swarming motility regulation sensor protein RssA [Rhodocyclales bacterium]|nr:Swarming motility regulation sensor protein RssA [Rhodocyclales bacterium]MDB5888075.1 Swarming motility regulation sensor protein RssA [Rhodocyclales bacterium]